MKLLKNRPIGIYILIIFSFFSLSIIFKFFKDDIALIGTLLLVGIFDKIYILFRFFSNLLIVYGLIRKNKWCYNFIFLWELFNLVLLFFDWISYYLFRDIVIEKNKYYANRMNLDTSELLNRTQILPTIITMIMIFVHAGIIYYVIKKSDYFSNNKLF